MGSLVVSAGGLTGFRAGDDLSASAAIVPVNDGRHGRSGFSFVTEFACPRACSGSVVSKPGVFSLEISGSPDNRLYAFRMFGSHPTNPRRKEFVLKANGESDPSAVVRVAGVCTYYYEPEQSNVGYRMSLYLDGELLGSCSCSRFVLNESVREPVAFAPGMDVRGVWLDGCARPLRDLFPGLVDAASDFVAGTFGEWSSAMRARAGNAGVRFVETPDLVVAVAEGAVTGNPILGAWNRRTSGPLLAGDGLGWELEYAGDDGVPRRMRSNSRNLRSAAEFRQDGFVVRSEGNGFEVRHEVGVDGGRIERALDVADVRGSRIRGTSFPRVTLAKLPGEDVLVEPQFGGALISRPTESYQSDGWMFPGGMVTMQFAGYYNAARDGVYFSAEDPSAVSKTYTSDGSNGRLLLAFFVNAPRDPGAAGAKHFSPTCRGALELYRGKWFELGQVYRKFLEKSAPWYDKTIPRADTPSWFMRNPLWITNLAQRRGRIPAVRYLRDYFGVPVSFVVGAFGSPDGCGTLGPNYKIKAEVLECILRLQREGIHFLSYANPRLWYCGPGAEKSNGFSRTGEPWSIKDERGVAPIGRYGPTDRDDYVYPCLGARGWYEFLCQRTRMMAESGIDGIYHDQLPCSIPYVCYDPAHGHKVGDPSVWLAGGLWRYCGFMMGELRREFPNLVHTGEETSEPFVNKIDGFLPWRYGRPGHVPLFQSVYAPRIQFVGRGCDIHRVPGSYEGFFPKYAEQLAYGEQIGWMSYQALSYPSPRRSFTKKLAHCRWVLADFLNSSLMEPPLEFERPLERFAPQWGVMDRNVVTVDKVLTSVWRHVDGRTLVMFLNTVNEAQEVFPIWRRGGTSFAICREGADRPERAAAAPKRVKLAPYGFEFWLADDASPALADALSRTLSSAAKFMREGRGALLSRDPGQFGKTASADAAKGVAASGAAWGLLAYIPDCPHCDYSRDVPEWADGWIPAVDGGLVNYGTVDFGTDAKTAEMSLATDETGVMVELFDVTGDVPDRKIAEFRPEAGDWHGYKTCTSPLRGKVAGKRDIVCRVKGGMCNLKSWKVLSYGESADEQPVGVVAHGKIDFAGMWTMFARRDGERLEMDDGGYAFCGEIDFGNEPKAVEFEVERADPGAVVEVVDVTELAPSTPLARIKVAKGTLSSGLSFKVEGRRSIVLMAKGGAATIRQWKVIW